MKRLAVLAAAGGILVAACGSTAASAEPKPPTTSIQVVTDWAHVKSGYAEPSEREIIVNGHHCVETYNYSGEDLSPAVGISCDWQVR